MEALGFSPWLPVTIQILAGLVVVYFGGRAVSRLRNAATPQQPELIESIELLLPQTQCGQCGYDGCEPYARAIAQGDAINRCPPGGNRTIRRLADLLNRRIVALDETHGKLAPPTVAFIRESECIGCTKCIQACPVDAIIGAAKLMHTVIVSECTGCDLCIAPCPVDCIDVLPAPADDSAHWEFPAHNLSAAANSQERQVS